MSASVRWAKTGDEVWVSSPFDQRYIDAIKAIPSNNRRWIASRRVWAFHLSEAEKVRSIVQDIYGVILPEPEDRSKEHENARATEEMQRMAQEINRLTRERDDALLQSRQSDALRRKIVDLEARNRELLRNQVRNLFTQGRQNNTRDEAEGLSMRSFLERFGQKGFRKIIAVAHPDAGGDAEMTKALTLLWETIEKEGKRAG